MKRPDNYDSYLSKYISKTRKELDDAMNDLNAEINLVAKKNDCTWNYSMKLPDGPNIICVIGDKDKVEIFWSDINRLVK